MVLSEFIDSRLTCTPQHDDALCMAEPDSRAPIIETHESIIETDIDVLVAEVADVTDMLELTLSVVC